MPLHAVAYTVCRERRSRVSVITSESSIIPAWTGFQERPPSVVFQGRCQVPA